MFFLVFKWNFLNSHLCPLPLALSLGTPGKSLALSPLPPPNRHSYTLMRFPLSFLFCRLSRLSPLTLSSYERYFSCLINFLAYHSTWSHMTLSLLHWGVQNWTQHGKCVSPGLSSEEEPLPSTSDVLPDVSQDSAAFLCHRSTLLAHGKLVVYKDPQAFFLQPRLTHHLSLSRGPGFPCCSTVLVLPQKTVYTHGSASRWWPVPPHLCHPHEIIALQLKTLEQSKFDRITKAEIQRNIWICKQLCVMWERWQR